jgi:hypothetical protein
VVQGPGSVPPLALQLPVPLLPLKVHDPVPLSVVPEESALHDEPAAASQVAVWPPHEPLTFAWIHTFEVLAPDTWILSPAEQANEHVVTVSLTEHELPACAGGNTNTEASSDIKIIIEAFIGPSPFQDARSVCEAFGYSAGTSTDPESSALLWRPVDALLLFGYHFQSIEDDRSGFEVNVGLLARPDAMDT